MRVLSIFFVAFLASVALGIGPARATSSLSLGNYDVALEGEGLARDEIFARIDSLESLHREAKGVERGELAVRLGQLYLATDLKKHKRVALAFLDEAVAIKDTRYEAARFRVVAAHRMRYSRDARKWLEGLVAEYPRDAGILTMLGRYHFIEACRRLRENHFRSAQVAFARAADADSNSFEAWYGLAASSVALRDAGQGLRAAEQLARIAPEREEPLFLEATAHALHSNLEAAQLIWTEALERSDPSVSRVFRSARGFLEAQDLERLAERVVDRPSAHAALARLGRNDALGEKIDWSRALEDSTLRARVLSSYWSELNTRPAQLFNPRQLEYWSRLVEADVLFGDAEHQVRGWDRPIGQALVRWGRPQSTFYSSGGANRIDELENAGVRLNPGEQVPIDVPLWVWTYRNEDHHFSLVFTDASYNALWTYGDASSFLAAAYRKQLPLMFTPEVDPPSPFALSVSWAAFGRGNDEAVLETFVGLRPREEFLDLVRGALSSEDAANDSLAVIEWALYDDAEQRIDFRREVLGEGNRRDFLHGRVGWSSGDGVLDPYVLPIGARLKAGRYRIAVEATGPAGRGHDAVTLDVDVPASEPPTFLEMSDLQVASAFAAYRPGAGVAGRYAKFGQVVVPVPDLRVPADTDRVGVYFELRQLGLTEAGLTSFDVTYEVFASSRELRMIVGESFERGDLERIDPLTMTFLEERTGVSPEGLVVKGTVLDVSALGSGDYMLVVTVRDRISGRESSRALPLRKRGS